MVLCEIGFFSNFLVTYVFLFVSALIAVFSMSAFVFYHYYMQPTFEKWQYKSYPEFPPVELVQKEIFHMIKSASVAVVCPVLSLYLSAQGYSKAYCGLQHGIGWEIFMFFFVMLFTDFFEFSYHRLGHSTPFFWSQHKSHHKFYNPSPFAVVADDFLDQLIRSMPLLVIPFIMPTNMDLMFAEFVVFFYGYGLYLHWGYELDYPDAHHPILNTSFQHYLHHARSGAMSPYHCGFFFKIWDNLFDCTWKEECFCAKCEREKGKRSRELWEKTIKPDYHELFEFTFWMNYLLGRPQRSRKKVA